jgi:MFS family permease
MNQTSNSGSPTLSNYVLQVKNFAQGVYPIVVLSLCGFFLFYKYVLQVYPSVITKELMSGFHLNGFGLGNLSATFFYSYVITQFFVGILLDKYGARLLTAIAIFCSALGICIFSQTTNLLVAELSRALMGFGIAFATVAYMKMVAVWFPPNRYAFLSGLCATAAMAGAVFGEAPLQMMIAASGWRESLYLCGLIGCGIAVLFILIVRNREQADATATTSVDKKTSLLFKDILAVWCKKQNWLLTIYYGLAFSPLVIFGGLWGNPFLQKAYHLTHTQSASFLSLLFIGLGLGSPILGAISDRLGKRWTVMFYGGLVTLFSVVLIVYFPYSPTWLVGLLLFVFGFTTGASMISFAMGKETNKIALLATIAAMINAGDAILDSISEPLVGKFLDLGWTGKVINGVHNFSLVDYQHSLSLLPIYLILAAVLLFFIREDKNIDNKTG